MSNTWKVVAQRVLTGEFLHWDVPLSRSTTSRELSGPGGVFGAIEPEVLEETADDGRPLLEEHSTALYVVEDDEIRGAGIIGRIATQGTVRDVEAAGFSAYPTGIPYVGNYLPNEPPDPTEVFKHLWDHVQSFPDGDLGVTVDTLETWHVLTGSGAAFTLRDFETRDCGETMNAIAQTVPFDYVEQHYWQPDHSGVRHHIKVGFPRLGQKRENLRFADGENIESFSHISPDGENFANDVYVYGQGAGSAMARARHAVRDGRLRRCAVVSVPNMSGEDYLRRRARREWQARQLEPDITEVTISDHHNARISAITPGDDIQFQAEVPWYGDVSLWLRVLAVEELGDQPGRAVLRTKRSDSFVYAPANSPTGEKVAVSI